MPLVLRRWTLSLASLTLLALLWAVIAHAGPLNAINEWRTKDKEALKGRFDLVARNLGAFESAYYTYTLEFQDVPPTAQDLIDSGHLRVPMINPYTGEPVRYPGGESLSEEIRSGEALPGDIWYLPDSIGGEVSMAGLYMDPNDPGSTKWMRRDIVRYINAPEREVIFPDEDSDSRTNQLTRVICEQLMFALDGYVIRFGEVPETLEALDGGDVDVRFTNPFDQSRTIRDSATHSPGDVSYTRVDSDSYDLIGWGDSGPVYYYSEAKDHWSVLFNESTGMVDVYVMTDERWAEYENSGLDSIIEADNETLNKLLKVAMLGEQMGRARQAEWASLHPDCPDCGSAWVYWGAVENPDGTLHAICRDAETSEVLDDCCCQDLPKWEAPE